MLRNVAGFTLVEMLVAVGVVVTLAGGLFAVAATAVGKASEAREVGAARKVIAGYVMAIADNDGILPAGYDRTATGVTQRDGRLIHGPAAQRYPWRLMPYLGDSIVDSLYVSNNRTQVDVGDAYAASLYPSFGMNYLFVGGDRQGDGSTAFESDCVTRLAQVDYPSKLMVFASSRGKGSGKSIIEGYSILTPPSVTGRNWEVGAEYRPESPPETYGHVDLRHSGRAVAAFLDGHIRLLSLEELGDMRVWSARAAELDNPNYQVERTTPTRGRSSAR